MFVLFSSSNLLLVCLLQTYHKIGVGVYKIFNSSDIHCVKSVRIRSYSGQHFLAFSQYSVRMQENANQNNSEYGHFLRSDNVIILQSVPLLHS